MIFFFFFFMVEKEIRKSIDIFYLIYKFYWALFTQILIEILELFSVMVISFCFQK